MMLQRQKNILEKLVKSYVETAQPVASADLAREFGLSSATIRNEMSHLEESGFIYQPHVSSGRVPTEQGFRFYISEFLKENKPSTKTKEDLKECLGSGEFQVSVKNLSKKLASISNEAVIVAFDRNDLYYTGLSNLFAKPEFQDHGLVENIGRLVDHLDEVIGKIYDEPISGVKIWVGSDNPFGRDLGSLVTQYKVGDFSGLISFIGPVRMYYENNLGLLNYSKQLIEGKA